MNTIKPGDTVDVVIKGVQFVGERTVDHAAGLPVVRDEHGRRYTMPPQAAITRPGTSRPADAAILQERIDDVLASIDHRLDEETIDPSTAYWLRKQLDPNPRHWPPQVGDVWDDGMPFGGSLWFARQLTDNGQQRIILISEEGGAHNKWPEELLEGWSSEIKLVYRRKDGGQ